MAATISPNDKSLKSNIAPKSGRMTTISFSLTWPKRISSSTSAAYIGFCSIILKSPGLNKSRAVRDTSIFGANGMSDPRPGSIDSPLNFANPSPDRSKFKSEALSSPNAKRVSPLMFSLGFLSSVTATFAPTCSPDPVPFPPAVALSIPS